MRNQEHRYPSCSTQRLPAEFSCFVASVLLEEGFGIFKDMHRIFKADAMFALISERFRRVPVEP